MRLHATDEIFIDAPEKAIARAILDLGEDASWWPGARTTGTYGYVEIDAPTRGLGRVRIPAVIGTVREWDAWAWIFEKGEIVGRAEWWLERFKDGTIVHYYLDAERGPGARWRRNAAVLRRHRLAVRRGLNGLKDALERAATSPRSPQAPR